MQKNYKKLGDYIQPVDERNINLEDLPLVGLSISKKFINSVANIIGTDLSNYKIIQNKQFACSLMQVSRDEKIPISMYSDDRAIMSPAYPIFEVKDTSELMPEYLMMWFSRSEFDRQAAFFAVGGIRGNLPWEDFCELEFPLKPIEKQREIVKEYNTIQNRIDLNNRLIQKLEETAQAIYKEWFVEFEFPDANGNPYKSSGGEMVWNEELGKEVPEGWRVGKIGDYSKVKSGFAFKSDWWQNNGIPVIKIGSISNNSIDINQLDFVSNDKIEIAKNYKANKGDIVVAMTGATIGKIGIIPKFDFPILVNQRVGLFDLGSNPMDKVTFLFITLLSDEVQNEIKNVGGDSAQANISNGQIENIKIIFSKNSIIEKYNTIGAPVMNNILHKIEENQKLTELKELLLSRLATV